jgi:PAS domain S-box-containing protein
MDRLDHSQSSTWTVASSDLLAGQEMPASAHAQAFFDHSPDGILTVDSKGTVLHANGRAQALSGQTAERLQGRPFWALFGSGAQELHQRLLEQALASQSAETEVGVLCPSGVRWYSVAILPFHDGPVKGAHVVLHDVGPQKALEARLIQTARLSSVGLTAASIAHDLNNSLTCLLMHEEWLQQHRARLGRLYGALAAVGERSPELTALLERHGISQSMEDLVGVVGEYKAGSERIAAAARDLRGLSRMHDQVKEVDVNALLSETAAAIHGEIRHRAKLVKELSALPTIIANPGHLSHVFLNLVMNAAQAITEGNASAHRIVLSTRQDGDRIRIAVSDSGAGIAPEHLPHIFDPFFSTKLTSAGAGLGMCTCREIITSYGGDMTVESIPGSGAPGSGTGTTVTVLLPVDTGRVLPKAIIATAPATRRGKILLIDDDPAVLRTYRRALADDHDVVCCAGGREALDLVETSRDFDVIVCDLMMPEISGVDLYELLSQRHPELAAKVVFITAGAFTPRAKDFMARLPNIRLEKPFGAHQLRTVIARLLGA